MPDWTGQTTTDILRTNYDQLWWAADSLRIQGKQDATSILRMPSTRSTPQRHTPPQRKARNTKCRRPRFNVVKYDDIASLYLCRKAAASRICECARYSVLYTHRILNMRLTGAVHSNPSPDSYIKEGGTKRRKKEMTCLEFCRAATSGAWFSCVLRNHRWK